MNIEFVKANELAKLTKDRASFVRALDNTVYIVRNYIENETIDEMRIFCDRFSKKYNDGWYPCLDNVPDYHRIHNNYPKAYVKSIQHAYYYHTWNQNSHLFKTFMSLFYLKNRLTHTANTVEQYLSNIPSKGPVARIVVHQYPRGGGGQEEHIDPVSDFARVQTIIQGSTRGVDYDSGGFYVHDNDFGVIDIDGLTQKGDLILASPGVKHGVAPIDSHESINWQDNTGRWIIMPIIIDSDINTNLSKKPIGLDNRG